MRVVATDLGFDGRDLRQPGEEFDMPDGAKGKWFEPVKAESVPEPKGAKGKTKSDDFT